MYRYVQKITKECGNYGNKEVRNGDVNWREDFEGMRERGGSF